MNSNSKRSMLIKRSQLLQQLRAFFYARSVIEVDTPMLSAGGVPDVHLSALSTRVQVPGVRDPQLFYLPTSPEYPMKRLLCEGSGDIFYLGKVFRDGDLSPRHQVEFTMLEWYRLGFSMFELMDEVATLINTFLKRPLNIERLSYQQGFAKYAGIEDILTASAESCQACLKQHGVAEIVGVAAEDKALWEQLILTEVIEPQLGLKEGKIAMTILFHFPANQASLAQISVDNPLVAERFELFVNGMELANGYHELIEADLYQERFNTALIERQQLGFKSIALDKQLLTTLKNQPLPDCSGVALGVDRLFALQQGFDDIALGIAFGLEDC
ncbi:EF-P lysine aminoacylase EpmA [Thiomicrorhabdus arctica]|uniref:EF-P lysine aminoacylase EpmA n=1 Tax=Thiomicrorhabdus arctica TaxID=131540 RepID=UPI00036D7DC6|nr:EF-P lysine aminoacylase EpmA [Thiomicrorhabdus arctica]